MKGTCAGHAARLVCEAGYVAGSKVGKGAMWLLQTLFRQIPDLGEGSIAFHIYQLMRGERTDSASRFHQGALEIARPPWQDTFVYKTLGDTPVRSELRARFRGCQRGEVGLHIPFRRIPDIVKLSSSYWRPSWATAETSGTRGFKNKPLPPNAHSIQDDNSNLSLLRVLMRSLAHCNSWRIKLLPYLKSMTISRSNESDSKARLILLSRWMVADCAGG